MLATVTVVGIVVLALLIWFLVHSRSQDAMSALMEKHRASSRIVSRAEYVEGMHHIPVVLALENDNVYYENADLQASFELARIDDIEYDDELATGSSVAAGTRALRLRSHGSTFEFVMPAAESAKWETVLPPLNPRRNGATGTSVA
ncbi:MAG TPA: hypothetical protein VLU46_13690 [Thermoanaerobaculia bacterium]|nr:hypothetical protein [Thermoanaerobaculia bacterium]